MKYPSLLYSFGLCLFSTILVVHHQSDTTSVTLSANSIPARLSTDCSSAKGLERVVCLTEAFKATLAASQVTAPQLPYSKTDAVKWSNFPEFAARSRRVGISLGSLNVAQLKAAKALMAAAMAQNILSEGFDELEGNLAADDYFGTTTSKTGTFSSGNYFMAFLGTPSTTGLWELQFGGHHYATPLPIRITAAKSRA